MVASGCGGASADTASDKANMVQQAPSAKSIVECGLNAVNEPLARTPNALKRAAQVYHLVDSTGNALGAFESVYGKTLPAFTYDEQAEALIILSGLDSCGNASATAPGDLALLLSGQPGSGTATGIPDKPTSDPTKQTSNPTNTKQTATATSGSGTATSGSGTATSGSGTATSGSGTATSGSGTATSGSGTTPTPTMTPDPPPTSPPPFRNCAQAFAAGVHDIPATDPRYRRALDRDGDGVACELNDDDMARPSKPGNPTNKEAQKHQMEITPQTKTSSTPTPETTRDNLTTQTPAATRNNSTG